MAIIVDKLTNFTQLTGTDEADVFRFLKDGNTDAISGFEDDKDVIDLGIFVGLSFADLLIADGNDGRVRIEFTDPDTGVAEKIFLKDNAEGFVAANLSASDFDFDNGAFAAPVPENTVQDTLTPFEQLTGTDSSDVFVMIRDGMNDAIRGFQDGLDLIDLSAFDGLSFADLTIKQGRNNKVLIQFDGGGVDADGGAIVEKIVLKNNADGFLAQDLTERDFIFASAPAEPPQAPFEPENTVTDTEGKDSLRGTEAADSFVFVVDGENDSVRNFEDGNDLLDMSAYAGLRFDDLTIEDVSAGRILITYANGEVTDRGRDDIEKILLRDLDGVTAADITADDFIFA